MPGLLVSYFRWTQRRGTILEEPLQSTAGRVHSRPVGGGVERFTPRPEGGAELPSPRVDTRIPPPPPQNEVEVTACAWGGAGHRGQCSLGLSCITSLDAQGLSCSKPLG